jgi:hypothetical protein
MSDINKKTLIAGDSHVTILGNNIIGLDPTEISRFPYVEILRLGPALAYTLPMDSSLNAGVKLTEYIERDRSHYDALMLSFGEVDTRVHILKQAVLQNISLAQVVTDVVTNYFIYIESLITRFDLPIFLWGPIATMPDAGRLYNPDYPTVGREQERNQITILLNNALAVRCAAHQQVHFISIADQLIGADLRTKHEYYQDDVHLNRKGLCLALNEIRSRLKKLGFDHFAARFPEQIFCAEMPMLCDISSNATITYLSSTQDDKIKTNLPITNTSSLPFIFHTNLEDHPRIIIDLGCVQMVEQIEIYNRLDDCHDRANSISISMSNDNNLFTNVYKNASRTTFGLNGMPLCLKFNAVTPFRYLQLELEDRNYFHLAEIKIYARSFLNPF